MWMRCARSGEVERKDKENVEEWRSGKSARGIGENLPQRGFRWEGVRRSEESGEVNFVICGGRRRFEREEAAARRTAAGWKRFRQGSSSVWC